MQKTKTPLLQRLRQLACLSQEELAQIVDISQSSLSRVELGKRSLRQDELDRLTKFFKVDPTVLEMH